jgi:hypothetical protein
VLVNQRLSPFAVTATVFLMVSCAEVGRSPSSLADYLGPGNIELSESSPSTEKAIEKCMRRQGFRYDPTPEKVSEQTEASIASSGYGITQSLRSEISPQDSKEGAYFKSLDPNTRAAYLSAMDGAEGKPGCMNVRVRKRKATTEVISLLLKLEDAVANDSRVVKIDNEWKRCMSQNGYKTSVRPFRFAAEFLVTDATKIRGKVNDAGAKGPIAAGMFDADLDALEQKEMQLAKTDLSCRPKNYAQTEALVRAEAESKMVNANLKLFQSYKT